MKRSINNKLKKVDNEDNYPGKKMDIINNDDDNNILKTNNNKIQFLYKLIDEACILLTEIKTHSKCFNIESELKELNDYRTEINNTINDHCSEQNEKSKVYNKIKNNISDKINKLKKINQNQKSKIKHKESLFYDLEYLYSDWEEKCNEYAEYFLDTYINEVDVFEKLIELQDIKQKYLCEVDINSRLEEKINNDLKFIRNEIIALNNELGEKKKRLHILN